MRRLSAHGLGVELPPGWEGSIFRRRAGRGETTNPILHLATFPLPPHRADFGAGAVELMGPGDVFVSLFDHGTDSAGAPLFSRRGLPLPLRPDDFDPASLQRALPGQAGIQRFFTSANRAFALYVVLGGGRHRHRVVPGLNAVLATLTVARR